MAIPLASAQIQTLGCVQQGECIDLTQTCDDCSYNNITSIIYPNKTKEESEISMTKSDTEYNYTFCGTQARGQYIVNGKGDPNSQVQVWAYDFEANRSGACLTVQESIVYLLLTAGIFIIFMISLYFTIAIPYKNNVDQKGMVIKITKLKYVKLAFFAITYALFAWFLNLLVAVSDSFLSLTQFYGFISFVFTIIINLTFPVAAFVIVLGFFEIIRDANLMKQFKLFKA